MLANKMSYENDVVIVVPAYNEEATIGNVVIEFLKIAHVVVVDDASTDRTGTIAKELGANVVMNLVNSGYGETISAGISWARNNGYLYAVTADADGQHRSSDLVQAILYLNQGYGLVVGVRDYTQRWSEKIYSMMGERIWDLRDPLSGIKGYDLREVGELGAYNTYESIGTEIAIKLRKKRVPTYQFQIKVNKRTGASRFGDGIKVNIKILKSLLKGMVLN